MEEEKSRPDDETLPSEGAFGGDTMPHRVPGPWLLRHKWAVAACAAVLVAFAAGVAGFIAVRAERRRAEAQWELIFEDDFEREELGEAWEVKSGEWKLEDGALVFKGEGSSVIYTRVCTQRLVRMEYAGWYPEDHQPGQLSCFFYASDHYCRNCLFHFSAYGAWFYHRSLLLDRHGPFVRPGRKYRIRAEFADGWLRAWVDGERFLARRVLFPFREKDRIGLRSSEGARFDEVRVWVRRTPEPPSPLAGADLLYVYDKYEEAAAEYAKLAATVEGELAEEARLKEGLAWLWHRSFDKAERAFVSVTSKEFVAKAAIGLAHVALARGRAEKGARIIHEAVERDPDHDGAWELRAWPFSTAEYLPWMGKPRVAAVLFECAARLPKQDDALAAKGLLEAGRGRFMLGELESAARLFDEVEERYSHVRPAAAEVHLDKAELLRAKGMHEKALAECAKAEEEPAGDAWVPSMARLARGRILRAAGKLEEALEALESVERDFAEEYWACGEARYERGVLLRATGRPEAAMGLFSSFESLFSPEGMYHFPSGARSRARIEKGLTLRLTGKFDQALEVFASVRRDFSPRYPADFGRAIVEGVRMLIPTDPDEAIKLVALLESEYSDHRAPCAWAFLLAGTRVKDEEEARSFLTRAAGYDDQPRYSTPGGFVLEKLDEKEFERLMFDWAWRADIEYWKGERALRQGNPDVAVKHFTRAVELNIPGDTWPLLEARLRLKELETADER